MVLSCGSVYNPVLLFSNCFHVTSFSSSNFGSPDGSGPELENQLAQIPTLFNWMSQMESHVTKTFGGFAAGVTEMKQNFSDLTARMCKVETGVTSASSVSGAPSWSWPLTGQNDTRSNRSANKNPLQNKNYITARLLFETRTKCQDCVEWFKDAGLPNSVSSPFCNTTRILVRQSRSPEYREIGRRFAPL